MKTDSEVSHPSHYNQGKIEVIEFIEDQGLNFSRGNAVKYIARAGKKDKLKELQDLQKAKWYIEREIELLAASEKGEDPRRPNEMNEEEKKNLMGVWPEGRRVQMKKEMIIDNILFTTSDIGVVTSVYKGMYIVQFERLSGFFAVNHHDVAIL